VIDPSSAGSGPVRIGLVGATGLIGNRLIAISSASDVARIVGLARRKADLPEGARVEMFIAEPAKWGEVIEAVRPGALICALGTTWKKAGRDESAFREVDHDLVVQTAQAAHEAGTARFVLISASGADPSARSFYMRVKGETEKAISSIGFKRLDIMRPGLLKGQRTDDMRPLERLAILASPLLDPLLPRRYAGLRSIEADIVAEAALGLAMRKAAGRFVHDNEAMRRAAREWRSRSRDSEEAQEGY